KKRSHRRTKAVKLLATAPLKVKRQRADCAHKTARALLRQYDIIDLEDWPLANLVRNRLLAKSISEAAWGQFRAIRAAQAADAGRRVVAVPAHDTSQTCSGGAARRLAVSRTGAQDAQRADAGVPPLWAGARPR